MGPKVQAAIEFVEQSSGIACIGSLADATAIINGEAGTLISKEETETIWGN
jgi:carbamate kinase